MHRRDKFRASKISGDRDRAREVQVEWNSVVDRCWATKGRGYGVRLKDVNSGETRGSNAPAISRPSGTSRTRTFRGIIDLHDNGYIATKPGTSYTNVEGVFACGDVQDHVPSGGDGGGQRLHGGD